VTLNFLPQVDLPRHGLQRGPEKQPDQQEQLLDQGLVVDFVSLF
jgi:hypothetical protein